MEKKAVLIASLIWVLAFSVVAATQFVNFGSANPTPLTFGGRTAPPSGAKPPAIAIFSPTKNNEIFASNNLSLAFNASVSEGSHMLTDVYYETDWQEGNTSAYHLDESTPDYTHSRSLITEFSHNQPLSDIPDGEHNITIIAEAYGSYVRDWLFYVFYIDGSSTVHFTVDTTPPLVTVLSIENKTYEKTDIPLNFTVTEAASQITYILDGQENTALVGNTTLTDLPEGNHNVIVCVIDAAGNKGTSGTIHFSVEVPKPFPAALVIASIVPVAAFIGLLLYFKKNKH